MSHYFKMPEAVENEFDEGDGEGYETRDLEGSIRAKQRWFAFKKKKKAYGFQGLSYIPIKSNS